MRIMLFMLNINELQLSIAFLSIRGPYGKRKISEIEREALERGQFDTTLDLLERRLPGQPMESVAILLNRLRYRNTVYFRAIHLFPLIFSNRKT